MRVLPKQKKNKKICNDIIHALWSFGSVCLPLVNLITKKTLREKKL